MNFRHSVLKWASKISGDGIYDAYQQALAWDKLSPEQSKENQNILLSNLLKHAYRHVPYYQEILKDNLILNRMGEPDLARFSEIPFLTKDILRSQHNALVSDDWKKRGGKPNTSGGSTGEPVSFIQDRAHRRWCVFANMLFYNHKLGKYPGEREINLWGSDRDVLQGSIGIKAKIINFLYNRQFLNAYRMDRDRMADYINRINTFKPISIWAYIESLQELAHFAESEGLQITPPKIIICTAGTLYPHGRELIESVFNAPLYNQYGSREVGKMACQCLEQDHLHLFPWSHFVEVVDEDGKQTSPGQEGEVVVTNLVNYAMPLIRYKIGDRAIRPARQCACGRETHILQNITGRVTEHLVSLNGTKIYGAFFNTLFFNRPWVKYFQVEQSETDLVINRIVASSPPPQTELDDIRAKQRKALGEKMNIKFEFIDEIKPSESGKFLYIISKVNKK